MAKSWRSGRSGRQISDRRSRTRKSLNDWPERRRISALKSDGGRKETPSNCSEDAEEERTSRPEAGEFSISGHGQDVQIGEAKAGAARLRPERRHGGVGVFQPYLSQVPEARKRRHRNGGKELSRDLKGQ